MIFNLVILWIQAIYHLFKVLFSTALKFLLYFYIICQNSIGTPWIYFSIAWSTYILYIFCRDMVQWILFFCSCVEFDGLLHLWGVHLLTYSNMKDVDYSLQGTFYMLSMLLASTRVVILDVPGQNHIQNDIMKS